MRSGVAAAFLLAALGLALPSSALAQEPEPAPAPAAQPVRQPPPRDVAVPRMRNPEADRGGAVHRESPPPAPPAATAFSDQGNRRRPPRESSGRPATASAPAPSSTSQGTGERRGAVRRPPSDGGVAVSPRDRAVARTGRPPRDNDRDRPIFVYPDYWSYNRYYYDPFYRGFHLGYLAYSPWGWTPAFYGFPYYYGGGYYHARDYDIGRVKLKVKPQDAEVYVDGYFAGYVDDFDGFFQSLRVDMGPHRIEVRKPGFETLSFDVHVQPDRTITFRGELQPVP